MTALVIRASFTAALLYRTNLSRLVQKESSYLVDPASSHMLVSKIKPCMSKHMPLMVKPRMAHYNSYSLLDLDYPTWITVVILELIHASKL